MIAGAIVIAAPLAYNALKVKKSLDSNDRVASNDARSKVEAKAQALRDSNPVSAPAQVTQSRGGSLSGRWIGFDDSDQAPTLMSVIQFSNGNSFVLYQFAPTELRALNVSQVKLNGDGVSGTYTFDGSKALQLFEPHDREVSNVTLNSSRQFQYNNVIYIPEDQASGFVSQRSNALAARDRSQSPSARDFQKMVDATPEQSEFDSLLIQFKAKHSELQSNLQTSQGYGSGDFVFAEQRIVNKMAEMMGLASSMVPAAGGGYNLAQPTRSDIANAVSKFGQQRISQFRDCQRMSMVDTEQMGRG